MLEQKTRIGEFEIIRLLGKGGMGEVYEAWQAHPERRVALKVLAPWLADNAEALERFWREAEVPAQLDHPAIVRIFSTGKCNGIAYYVMQLVNGISLAGMIVRANEPTPATRSYAAPAPERAPSATPPGDVTVDGPCSADDPPILKEYRADRFRTLARLGIQAARALAWTHKKGFLHRDIKPSNIMVDHHNQLYLVDFGLTRALGSGLTTRTGTLVGTPYYMSPEQAVGHPLDPRSDIFSLGVSLYQLASGGRGPYKSAHDDSDSVLREVRAGVQLPLRKLAPQVPALLEMIIQRAIDPEPKRRYQKAEDLADDLEKFLNEPTATSDERTPPRSTAAYWWSGIAIAALVVAAGTYLLVAAPWRAGPGDNPGGDAKTSEQRPAPIVEVEKKGPLAPPTLRDFFKRQRPVKTEVKLLRADNQPVLYKPLLNKLTFHPMAQEIIAFPDMKADNHRPSMMALDDPGEINFEYALEMRTFGPRSEFGIFFGWRANLADPLERPRFLVVQLDPRGNNRDPHGALRIGSWMFEDPKDARGGMSEQNPRGLFSPKDGMKGVVPLPAPKNERVPYYRVWVRVVNKKISVGVEDLQPVEFDVPWMMNNDKWLKTYSLDPHGALGVWARHGPACFRNLTIMALPTDQ